MNVENNELIVDDVPETSDQNLEGSEVDTSTNDEQIQDKVQETVTTSQEDIEKMIEERANKRFEEQVEKRLIRERVNQERKTEKELAKYKQLENIIKTGLEVESLDEAITKSTEFYREQGINIPEYIEPKNFNEREQKILANADADEIINLGIKEMESEANRIASIPEAERSIREQTTFNTLCKAIIEKRQIDELKSKGIQTEILEDKNFKEFKDKFAYNTPVSDIYEIYSKMNPTTVEKPASAGSAKNENGETKETFSVEKINNMTPQELMKHWNNPEFRKIAGLDIKK